MANNTFLKVEDVAEILGVSKSYAYKIVRSLNAELKEKGFLVVSGRINRRYFFFFFCYGTDKYDERNE